MPEVKPAGAMKTPSGRFVFVVLAGIAIVTVISCRTLQLSPNQSFGAIIGDPNVPKYVPLKNGLAGEGKFRADLAHLKRHGGVCQIEFLRKDGEKPEVDYCDHVSLKTDRIIKSAAANNVRREELAANDPHVTYRVQSNDPTDIANVLSNFPVTP
jgi:hypothetical protein